MKLSALSLSLFLSQTFAMPKHLDSRGGCPSDYTACAPPGATTVNVPKIGDSAMLNIYVDLVGSSLPDGNKGAVRAVHHVQRSASLCCISSLTCLVMSNLGIPFCYDRYTTNYFLPDGSYGTVIGGKYETASGDVANLLSGDYVLENGTSGIIYANNESVKPNTVTLDMPAQFTGQGVGSVIPPSALGALATVTYTVALPGTTVPPITIAASTRSEQVIGVSLKPATTHISVLAGSALVLETTLSTIFADSTATSMLQATLTPLSTISATTIGGSTVPGTTVASITTTLTSTIPAAQSTNTISSDSVSATSSTTQSRASSLEPFMFTQVFIFIPVMCIWI